MKNYSIQVKDGHHIVTLLPEFELSTFETLGEAFISLGHRIQELINYIFQEVRKSNEYSTHINDNAVVLPDYSGTQANLYKSIHNSKER